MTTIAYAKGVVAADTRATDASGFIYPGRVTKIVRLSDGSVFCWCGVTEAMFEALSVFDQGHEPTWRRKSGTALLLRREGRKVLAFENEGSLWQPKESITYYAIGSGSPYAYGALESGKSARRAVEIAMKFDASTGGDIIEMKV